MFYFVFVTFLISEYSDTISDYTSQSIANFTESHVYNEDLDQHVHPRSLVKVFAVLMKKLWVFAGLPIGRLAKYLNRLCGCACSLGKQNIL